MERFKTILILSVFAVAKTTSSPPNSPTNVYQFQKNSETLSSPVANIFKGEVKQNVEKLFEINWEYLNCLDEFAEVTRMLEETYKILSYKETLFEKEKESGIRSQEYITKLKTAYEKWEKLEQHLKRWTSVEQSLTTQRWIEIQGGSQLLQKVQQSKSQIETQMREVEAEHHVYASRKEELQKGGETIEQTYGKVKEETLSKLNSTIEKLLAEKVDIFEEIETLEIFRKIHLDIAAQSWIDEKTDVVEETKQFMETIFEGAKRTFSPKDETEKVSRRLYDTTHLKENLKQEFDKNMEIIVEKYEEKIQNKTEEHNDDEVSKLRQEIVRYRVQFKKQHNYLADTQYCLVNPKLSDIPLQNENVVLEVVDNILKRDSKNLNKRFAEKLMAKAKFLKDIIANNPACRFKENLDYSRGIALSAHLFSSEVLMVILQPLLIPLHPDIASTQAKTVTEKHHRSFQKMMEYFTRMEQCAKTLRKIEDTVTNVEQWKSKFE